VGRKEQQAAPPQAPAEPAYAPAPAEQSTASMDDKLAQLKQLGELRDAGVLSDAEFEGQKDKILHG
jgi:hypothetical protein